MLSKNQLILTFGYEPTIGIIYALPFLVITQSQLLRFYITTVIQFHQDCILDFEIQTLAEL